MGIGYATAYRTGIIPWEKAGRAGRPTLERLLDREEADRPDGIRRAIDLGGGRGAHTKLLLDRGWDAIGVDDVRQAVDTAVHRNGLDDARFVIGDVRHLVHSGVGSGFDLFLDVGCFQTWTTRAAPSWPVVSRRSRCPAPPCWCTPPLRGRGR